MGREVRMIPPGWEHPRKANGRYRPLWPVELYMQAVAEWDAGESGCHEPPNSDDYMPAFPDGTATHYCMYEDTTEGTPISPGFGTPEALARWLADTGASAFGAQTATYEQWLAMIRQGWAHSLTIRGGVLASGVADAARGKE